MEAARASALASVGAHEMRPLDREAFWRPAWGEPEAAALARLRERRGVRGPFDSPAFLTASAATLVPSTAQIWTLALGSEPDLAQAQAIVPFTVGRERLYGAPCRVARALGDPLADRFDPILPVHGWARMMAALQAAPFEWDVLILSETCLGVEARDEIDAAARSLRWALEHRVTGRTPIIECANLDQDDPSKSYPKRLRSRVRNAINKVEGEHAGVLELQDLEADALDGALERARTLEALTWKGETGVGMFTDPNQLAFVRALVTDPSRDFTVRFYWLTLDGQLGGFSFNLVTEDRNFDYQGSFDPAFASCSPGTYLIDAIIRDCQASGISALDASRSSIKVTPQHAAFPHVERVHRRIFAYRPTFCGRLAGFLSLRLRPAARALQARLGTRTDGAH